MKIRLGKGISCFGRSITSLVSAAFAALSNPHWADVMGTARSTYMQFIRLIKKACAVAVGTSIQADDEGNYPSMRVDG
jgi:hypothetical protein